MMLRSLSSMHLDRYSGPAVLHCRAGRMCTSGCACVWALWRSAPASVTLMLMHARPTLRFPGFLLPNDHGLHLFFWTGSHAVCKLASSGMFIVESRFESLDRLS